MYSFEHCKENFEKLESVYIASNNTKMSALILLKDLKKVIERWYVLTLCQYEMTKRLNKQLETKLKAFEFKN